MGTGTLHSKNMHVDDSNTPALICRNNMQLFESEEYLDCRKDEGHTGFDALRGSSSGR